DGSETVRAHVLVAVAAKDVEALRARYTTAASALGAKAVTFFPGLAWRYTAVRGGAQLVSVEGPLRDIGLAPGDIVLEAERRPVATAEAFAAALGEASERLTAAGGSLQLLVKTGDGEPRMFTLTFAGPKAPKPAPAPSPDQSGPRAPAGTGGVNIW